MRQGNRSQALGVAALALLAGVGTAADVQEGLDPSDAVRLGEAFRLADSVQARVWPGWEATPFPVLLVGSEREFLVRAASPPADFELLGVSALLRSEVRARPRHQPPGLLATFPAFGAGPVVVIGGAAATRKRSTDWVLSVLHEHFHQYQMSDPGYYPQTRALDLAGGDESGTWMLNYPFPYAAPDVAGRFGRLSGDLAALIVDPSAGGRAQFWDDYAAFVASLAALDRRYLALQVWQEGVARYVELRVAQAAADLAPTLEFRALPDYEPFAETAERKWAETLDQLRRSELPTRRREAFYAFGAGLALLLDQEGVGWKARYLADKFSLERYRTSADGAGRVPHALEGRRRTLR